MIIKFFQLNHAVSKAFDKLLPASYTLDGNRDFVASFAPPYITMGCRLIDIGGGKTPFLSLKTKAHLKIHVTGVDISLEELARAPVGAYDETLCVDITKAVGDENGDVCVCQAVLEHVRDTEAGIRAISSFLREEGVALVFVPSRNAIYARLNKMLPQALKKKVLFWIYPSASKNQGFPSYYDRCTPKEFKLLAKNAGLELIQERCYFVSSYFSFFFPLYMAWRLWTIVFRLVADEQAAETFCMAFKKI
jgi:SAM-dependent methyltransferase